MRTYTVTVANTFDAHSPQDALQQMTSWIADYAYRAGYRVTCEDTGESVFLDAEETV